MTRLDDPLVPRQVCWHLILQDVGGSLRSQSVIITAFCRGPQSLLCTALCSFPCTHHASCWLDVGILSSHTWKRNPTGGMKPGGADGAREAGRVEPSTHCFGRDEATPPAREGTLEQDEGEKKKGKEDLTASRPSVLVDAIVIWQRAVCMWRP